MTWKFGCKFNWIAVKVFFQWSNNFEQFLLFTDLNFSQCIVYYLVYFCDYLLSLCFFYCIYFKRLLRIMSSEMHFLKNIALILIKTVRYLLRLWWAVQEQFQWSLTKQEIGFHSEYKKNGNLQPTTVLGVSRWETTRWIG